MRKLFLAALVASLCTPVIMAQDAARIYGDLPTPRFNPLEINRPEAEFSLRDATNDVAAPADGTGGRPRCRRCPSGHTHVELYGGYSFLLFDSFETNNVNFNNVLNNKIYFHGADLSATFNFLRYVGAQFDFSINTRNEDLVQFGLTGAATANIQHYLFGFQVKNNSKDGGRFRPFGHFLLGISRQRLDFNSSLLSPIIGNNIFTFNKNYLALNAGGGIDVRINGVFSIRPIKIDYLPVFTDNFTISGVTFNGRTQRNLRAGAGVVFHF